MGRFIEPEQLYTHSNGVGVRFKRQAAKQDRRHLLIVFSGFCPLGRYNFDGTVADGCRTDILWINDLFNGNNSYYLCENMHFGIEEAVSSLIELELERLHISRDNCTLLGYSKGGSAALYFGIKHNIENIIASAPQMHIGSFTRVNFPSSFGHMVGNGKDTEVELLDSILPNALREEVNTGKNIYLISSEQDQFHSTEIVPYLDEFRRYRNLNIIMTQSSLVDEHKVVGAYNTPIILSIIYALGEGCTPVFGDTTNGGGRMGIHSDSAVAYHRTVANRKEIVCSLDQVSIVDGILFPEGVCFLRGVAQEAYGAKRVELVLVSAHAEFSFSLGTSIDRGISAKYFDRYFCNYSYAGFKSINSEGISLEHLPYGKYVAYLRATFESASELIPLSTVQQTKKSDLTGFGYFHWSSGVNSATLVKRPIFGTESADAILDLSVFRVSDGVLYIEGIFAAPHIEADSYDHGRYKLVLVSETKTFALTLAQGNRPKLDSLFDGYSNQSKAYFTTSKYAGITAGSVVDGVYDVLVSLTHNSSIITREIREKVSVVDGQFRAAEWKPTS